MNFISNDLGLFFGRFHVLLVHLPIGFLVLLVGLEALACLPWFRHLRVARGAVLLFAVPACVLSALCGWLLARSGGYDAKLLDWHMWAGFGMAGACVLAMGMHWLSWRAAYFVALVVAFCGLLVTGHFGGSLTHGQDYLTHYLPAFERQLRGGASAAQPVSPAGSALRRPAFASMVQPVMAAKCVACHGPNKAKAGLRLDTLEAILKGRRSGPVVIPGQSAASSFIKCLVSPPQQDEHMPPDGKPQLTPDEIAMLRWWIDAGAPGNKTPAELKLPAHLQYLITAVLAPAKPAATPNPKP